MLQSAVQRPQGFGGGMPGAVAAMPAAPAAPKPVGTSQPLLPGFGSAIGGMGPAIGGAIGSSPQPHPMPTGGAGSMWFPENGPGLAELGQTGGASGSIAGIAGMGGALGIGGTRTNPTYNGVAAKPDSFTTAMQSAVGTAVAHQPTPALANGLNNRAAVDAKYPGEANRQIHLEDHEKHLPTPAVQPPAGPAGRPIAHPPAPTVAGAGGQINTGVPGAISSFGAGGDLRNKQILPGQDPRLAATEGDVNAARDNLAGGPDRFQLAQDRYKQFATDSAPGDFDALRALRQSEASSGRIGSSMEAKGFADLGSRIQAARSSAKNQFMTNALEGTIQDRRNNLSDLSGLEGQQFDQGQASRNEYRGERGYQAGQAQQSWDNNRTKTMDEEALTQGQWNRDEGRLHDMTGLGYQGDPSGTMLDVAGQIQNGANQSGGDISDLLKQYAYGQSVDPSRIPTAPSGGNVWGGAATRPYSFGYQL